MGVVSAWLWECRPPASVWCSGSWGHLSSCRLRRVQSHSYLNQCEDILSLISIKLGSWIKNSAASTSDIAETSLPSSSEWCHCSSWAVGNSFAVIDMEGFSGPDSLTHPVLSDKGVANSWQEFVIRLCATCWQIATSLSSRSFVQSFTFYIFLQKKLTFNTDHFVWVFKEWINVFVHKFPWRKVFR